MKWYEIKALAGRVAEIFIFDVIVDYAWDESEVTAKGFIDDLQALGDLDEIRVRINSPGGSVYAGNVIYNVLKRQSAKVTVIVDGIAASIASVVAMAGDTVIMPANAMMMIHNPMAYANGNAEDLQKVINRLETAKVGMLASYSSKTGLSEEKLIEMLDAETWLTATEAKELGFADEVGQPVQMAAEFDLSRYHNPPQSLTNKQQPSAPQPLAPVAQQSPARGEDPMKLEELQAKHPDLYATVVANAKKAGHDEGLQAGIAA
ncbi:MAG: Clp protease ClpP, partial [Desulfuromusa sp.]|nr:Clp protease ClpP [Desulfuromusa sp.]